MSTKKIIVLPENEVCEVQGAEDFLTAVRRNRSLFLDAACNGARRCGKCRIIVREGKLTPVSEAEQRLLKPEEIENGVRLACCCAFEEDETQAVIEIPSRGANKTVVLDTVEQIEVGEHPLFCEKGDHKYGIAVDIGTTTVATVLLEMDTGKTIAKASDVNPQVVVGGDVLTRIAHTMEKADGLNELQSLIVDGLNRLTEELFEKSGKGPEDICGYVVAANCTMLHLLLGVDPAGISRAPFIPAFKEGQMLKASDIGLLPGNPDAGLYCLPSVSAYIGADITAGIYMSRIFETKDNVLFIDIGTNGEIVLSVKGKLHACSCAVGPAMEGMNITCGMRAAEGAIEHIAFKNGVISTKVIGDKEPIGICGSGVLEAVAALLEAGAINPGGRLHPRGSAIEDLYFDQDGTKGFYIWRGKQDIVFTQQDVRQIQLAKGAVLSGFTALVERAGITFEELDKVIIAGQFGSHLQVETLILIEMLPEEVRGKVDYIGNSSLAGAESVLMDRDLVDIFENLAKDVDYFELGAMKGYQDLFIKCLTF